MHQIIDFLKSLRGEHQQIQHEQSSTESMSSGDMPRIEVPFSGAHSFHLSGISYRHSATGEVYALKEAGRALLADLDSQPDWAMEWGPDPDVVERFRALVEPKRE